MIDVIYFLRLRHHSQFQLLTLLFYQQRKLLSSTFPTMTYRKQPAKGQLNDQMNIQDLCHEMFEKVGNPFIRRIKMLNKPLDLGSIKAGHRKVKSKMITKLIAWMQKISLATFEFSLQTLECAIRILVRYLSVVDEAVGNLQLLGCVCLSLSSKIHERTTVALISYVECSMHIFSEEKMSEREAEVYERIGYSVQSATIIQTYQYIKVHLIDKYLEGWDQNLLNAIFQSLLKDIEILEADPYLIVKQLLITLTQEQADQNFSPEDLLPKIKLTISAKMSK